MPKAADRRGVPSRSGPPEAGGGASLRERKHELVLREIERVSWELFAAIGFDRTTVEEISRRAGVSRRTFFRYFHSKEDLLSYSLTQSGLRIRERFAAEPANREPLAALEHAMISILEDKICDTRRPAEMIGLMLVAPALRSRFLYHLNCWVPLLVPELVRRRAHRGNAARCELTATLYCAAFDWAHMRWYREPNTDLVVLLRGAFRQLGSRRAAAGRR